MTTIAKLFEKHILSHISKNYNLFPAHQFGFWPKPSTTQQCHQLVSGQDSQYVWTRQILHNSFTWWHDFDKVWHDGLWIKINKLVTEYHKFFIFYLKHIQFRTKIWSNTSNFGKIKADVSQGSCFGLLIYLCSVYKRCTSLRR